MFIKRRNSNCISPEGTVLPSREELEGKFSNTRGSPVTGEAESEVL